MQNDDFPDEESWYYNLDKKRISSMISTGRHRIFDLGCGAGRLGRRLLETGKAREVIGAEIFEPAASKAALHYSKVHIGDIESMTLEYEETFDYVVCGDILEHLRNPWLILRRLRKWIVAGGYLIVSVPNVRYWQVIAEVLLRGQWRYQEAGILDRTHLRFFTRRSISEAIGRAGFTLDSVEMVIHGKRKNALNNLTFGIFQELLGSQILVRARK
jgi:2-polyprenyl-3-methyl-5-hydroxy-6-metoxy-1,4-benzoquinol methylase